MIVRVDGLTIRNFKSTYLSICGQLGISPYIDNNAVKATQFSALSYDEDLFVNPDSDVFKAEEETVPMSIVYEKERKAYTIDAGTKTITQIRFNNLDEIQLSGSYTVNWDGYEYVNCWIPMKKLQKGRNSFLLAYANNFVWLNPWVSKQKAADILMSVNRAAFIQPLPARKV